MIPSDTQRAPSDRAALDVMAGEGFLSVDDDIQRITKAKPQPIISVFRRGTWVVLSSPDSPDRVHHYGSHAGNSTVHMRARWVQVIETGEIVCALTFTWAAEKMDGEEWMASVRKAALQWPLSPADIVWPLAWERDTDGRGFSLMEQQEWLARKEKAA